MLVPPEENSIQTQRKPERETFNARRKTVPPGWLSSQKSMRFPQRAFGGRKPGVHSSTTQDRNLCQQRILAGSQDECCHLSFQIARCAKAVYPTDGLRLASFKDYSNLAGGTPQPSGCHRRGKTNAKLEWLCAKRANVLRTENKTTAFVQISLLYSSCLEEEVDEPVVGKTFAVVEPSLLEVVNKESSQKAQVGYTLCYFLLQRG